MSDQKYSIPLRSGRYVTLKSSSILFSEQNYRTDTDRWMAALSTMTVKFLTRFLCLRMKLSSLRNETTCDWSQAVKVWCKRSFPTLSSTAAMQATHLWSSFVWLKNWFLPFGWYVISWLAFGLNVASSTKMIEWPWRILSSTVLRSLDTYRRRNGVSKVRGCKFFLIFFLLTPYNW